jgi:hypothetical protein
VETELVLDDRSEWIRVTSDPLFVCSTMETWASFVDG